MRSAHPSSTPALHVVPKSSRTAATTVAPGTPHQQGQAAQQQQLPSGPDAEQSVYLEHSIEDSDVIVMRTMSDWSGSGAAPPVASSFGRDRRTVIMPQIAEAADGEAV